MQKAAVPRVMGNIVKQANKRALRSSQHRFLGKGLIILTLKRIKTCFQTLCDPVWKKGPARNSLIPAAARSRGSGHSLLPAHPDIALAGLQAPRGLPACPLGVGVSRRSPAATHSYGANWAVAGQASVHKHTMARGRTHTCTGTRRAPERPPTPGQDPRQVASALHPADLGLHPRTCAASSTPAGHQLGARLALHGTRWLLESLGGTGPGWPALPPGCPPHSLCPLRSKPQPLLPNSRHGPPGQASAPQPHPCGPPGPLVLLSVQSAPRPPSRSQHHLLHLLPRGIIRSLLTCVWPAPPLAW